jgi:hypothetical protein
MGLPHLIGIAGRARTGKNTLATFIQAQYGGYQYAFAAPIRAMLKSGLGVDMDTPYWSERKEQIIPAIGKSPRQLMQTLGTEWGRQLINPDLWLILASGQLASRGPGMIVTDMRFENEASWVRRNKGVVLHLERNAAPTVNSHSSETPINRQPEDIVVYNDLDLESLQLAVSKLWA